MPSARRYLPGSLIMETTWQTHTGWLIVRDALVMGPWHDIDRRSRTHRRTPMDWDAEHILLRTVRCVSGTAELMMSCEPAFDYHRISATWEYSADAYGEAVASAKTDPDAHPTLRLTTNLRIGLEGREARARTRLKEGDDVFVALSWSKHPARRHTRRPPTRCGRPRNAGGSGSTSATSPTTRGGRICSAVRLR
ncbi:putative glycoside hydrolase [Mycobacterium xenopi 3993]|nr:putative glycoside hydrolase [Mycobacterium xenopi 3993]